MENKISIIGIIISDVSQVEKVNEILHNAREYIVGRLGIPYRERKVNVISIVVDAPNEVLNSLSGKLGMLTGVSSKVLLTK